MTLLLQLLDLAAGMKNGVWSRPPKASYLGKLWLVSSLGRHRQLARAGNGTGTTLGQQIRQFDLVVLRHRLLDVVDGDQLLLQGQQVAAPRARKSMLMARPVKLALAIPVEGAFQFTDVGAQTLWR